METKEITKAIIKVMEEVNNIWKNTVVWTWNNSYKAVSDKDVKQTIRTSMIKNWLSILQTWIEWNIRVDRWEEEAKHYNSNDIYMKSKQSVFTEVKTKYLLLHESWESIELAWYGQWVDSQDKGAGKATTYALKNTLINIFLVPTWEDTDNTHSEDISVPKNNYTKKVWYNDTKKNIDAWTDAVADWKTTWKAILEKITITDWKSINSKDKELILALDK